MPLNIRSEEVNRLAGELAARKGVSKTEAVKLALVQALEVSPPPREPSSEEIERRWAAIRRIQQDVASRKPTGLEADKAFFDELSGE